MSCLLIVLAILAIPGSIVAPNIASALAPWGRSLAATVKARDPGAFASTLFSPAGNASMRLYLGLTPMSDLGTVAAALLVPAFLGLAFYLNRLS